MCDVDIVGVVEDGVGNVRRLSLLWALVRCLSYLIW